MINTMLQKSFLEDMNDSVMMNEIIGEGFGASIDYIIAKSKEPTGLFESAKQRKERETFNAMISGDMDEEEMFDTGEMIDALISGGKGK